MSNGARLGKGLLKALRFRQSQLKAVGQDIRIASEQPFSDPGWITAAVHHRMDEGSVISELVVNRERKPFREELVVISVLLVVNSRIKTKRLDFREEIGQEVGAEPGTLVLVKVKSFNQVLFRLIKNLQVHLVRSEIRFLASSQSLNRALPSARSRSRSSKRS